MEALAALLATKLTIGKAVGLLLLRLEQFAMIAVVFVPLERLIPFHARQRLFRPRLVLDLLHYFVGGLFIILFVQLTYHLMPLLIGPDANVTRSFSVRHLPGWAQFAVFEAGWTFLGYWVHRLLHVYEPLWRMHSIHESPLELDWLSAFRLHPLEPVLFQVLTIMPLWLLQVDFPVAMAYTIYAYVMAHVQHANVVFPIGPLKYFLPTPEFHRWHHARVRNADGSETASLVNFGQYPIWDQLFGTFYLPKARPAEYGSADGDKIPMNYVAQLAYPFGAHRAVLTWKARLFDRFRFSSRLARVRASLAPTHESLERRLAGLCLLRSAGGGVSTPAVTASIPAKDIS